MEYVVSLLVCRCFASEDDTSRKSSPQYIGRRLSAARRSAQVSPAEVQAMLQHRLDLTTKQTSLLQSDRGPRAASHRNEDSPNATDIRYPGLGLCHRFASCHPSRSSSQASCQRHPVCIPATKYSAGEETDEIMAESMLSTNALNSYLVHCRLAFCQQNFHARGWTRDQDLAR